MYLSFAMVCCERAATDIDGVEAPAERARVFMAVRQERAICSVGMAVVALWGGEVGVRGSAERDGAKGGARPPGGMHFPPAFG